MFLKECTLGRMLSESTNQQPYSHRFGFGTASNRDTYTSWDWRFVGRSSELNQLQSKSNAVTSPPPTTHTHRLKKVYCTLVFSTELKASGGAGVTAGFWLWLWKDLQAAAATKVFFLFIFGESSAMQCWGCVFFSEEDLFWWLVWMLWR